MTNRSRSLVAAVFATEPRETVKRQSQGRVLLSFLFLPRTRIPKHTTTCLSRHESNEGLFVATAHQAGGHTRILDDGAMGEIALHGYIHALYAVADIWTISVPPGTPLHHAEARVLLPMGSRRRRTFAEAVG